MTQVETALRMQREVWREICDRVSSVSSRELPHETPKRILLFGIGSSLHAAKLTAYSLIRDRQRARIPVVSCSSMEIGHEVIPQKGDWAFAFTHRGGSEVTRRAAELCHRHSAFTIQVSGVGAPVSEYARFALTTSPMEQVEPHTMSVSGAVCAATSLLLGIKVFEEWDALRSLGDPNLEMMRERAGQGPSVLVGEWEGEWLAREGALKLMEMARLPVRAFGSEEFIHGPRHSVGAKDPIWHIALSHDERTNEIDAAHRIGVAGASPLAWVPALLQLQWLALAVALNRGVDPDLK